MRISPRAGAAALALSLAGCSIADGLTRREAPVFTIESAPSGARVVVDGAGECETPCTIRIDQPTQVTLAKAGFNPARLTLAPGDRRQQRVELELAAPAGDVDETALPEL